MATGGIRAGEMKVAGGWDALGIRRGSFDFRAEDLGPEGGRQASSIPQGTVVTLGTTISNTFVVEKTFHRIAMKSLRESKTLRALPHIS
jgi:hypothetical protein